MLWINNLRGFYYAFAYVGEREVFLSFINWFLKEHENRPRRERTTIVQVMINGRIWNRVFTNLNEKKMERKRKGNTIVYHLKSNERTPMIHFSSCFPGKHNISSFDVTRNTIVGNNILFEYSIVNGDG